MNKTVKAWITIQRETGKWWDVYNQNVSNIIQDKLKQELAALKSSREKAERVVEAARRVKEERDGVLVKNTLLDKKIVDALCDAVETYDAALKDGERKE